MGAFTSARPACGIYADTVLLRYLKAQGFVLLCGGLVGPIFLAVYFALGADPLLKWMFWWGLLVTGADVLIALAMANYGARSAATSQFLESSGVLALARITSINDTPVFVNDQQMIKVAFHVEMPGGAGFDSEQTMTSSPARMQILNGRKLVVLVDPATNKYQIDWDRSALVNGAVPAQFTLDEDGKTYDLSGQAAPLMDIMRILKANNIPVQGTIDIRSNPAVRQQVMQIVRAAGRTSAPASGQPSSEPARSVADRLTELDTLRDSGTITDAEYTAKRQQIISEL